MPFAASAFASLAGKASFAGRPKPALSKSPSATSFTGALGGDRRRRPYQHREQYGEALEPATVLPHMSGVVNGKAT